MNVPFSLPNDKTRRDDNPLQPFKIVSLWELMQTFKADKLYMAIMQLSHSVPTVINIGQPDFPRAIPLKQYVDVKEKIDFVCEELERIDFVFALDCARKLQRVVYEDTREDSIEGQEGRWVIFSPEARLGYRAHIEALASNFERELSLRTVMFLGNGKKEYFNGSKTALSGKAKEKFPLAQKDMDEAGKCFALRQHTASVFHLMRVMEQTVQALGRKFKIPRHHKKTWGKILRKVDEEIGTMKEDTAVRKMKKQECHHSRYLLHSVCEGIRNPLVHPGVSDIDRAYSEEETLNLINLVKTFIDDFVKLPRLNASDFERPS